MPLLGEPLARLAKGILISSDAEKLESRCCNAAYFGLDPAGNIRAYQGFILGPGT